MFRNSVFWTPRETGCRFSNAVKHQASIESIKVILTSRSFKWGNDDAIAIACKYGHVDLVAFLLQDAKINPAATRNIAVRYASQYGHVAVMKLLFQDEQFNTKAATRTAFICAFHYGQDAIMKLVRQHLDDLYGLILAA